MQTPALIEALLFASGSPLSLQTLAKACGISEEEVVDVVSTLQTTLNVPASGIHLLIHEQEVQLVANPLAAPVIEEVFSQEISQEITRPQMEVLAIIAYRSPIGQIDIERIRGGNCTLILRNLEIRDLISSTYNKERFEVLYTLSTNALRVLGILSVDELPSFSEFHTHEALSALLATEAESQDL